MTKTQNPKAKVPAFAAALQAARHDRNWSLRDVEKRMGRQISRQTILRAEQGDVGLETLFKLIALYGIKGEDKAKLLDGFQKHQLAEARAA